jgi:hypothetical protein
LLRASWQKQPINSECLSKAKVREHPSKDTSIVCTIDNRTFHDPIKTPSHYCGTAYLRGLLSAGLLEYFAQLCVKGRIAGNLVID